MFNQTLNVAQTIFLSSYAWEEEFSIRRNWKTGQIIRGIRRNASFFRDNILVEHKTKLTPHVDTPIRHNNSPNDVT